MFSAGHKIDAVKASNDDEKRENLQKITKFMINNGIKLHHISIEGKLRVLISSVPFLVLVTSG